MSSSSSLCSCMGDARFGSGLGSVGEAALFFDDFSAASSVLPAARFGLVDGFSVKMLEMVACFRFKDGEDAEDWEEFGAILPGDPVQDSQKMMK